MKKITLLLIILLVTSCKNNDTTVEPEMIAVDTSSVSVTENIQTIDSSKIKELKSLFKHKKDEFSESQTEWITPIASAKYRNENGIYCYFSKNNLRFVFQYHSDDWLFINKCQFLIDDKPFTYIPDQMKRDNDETGITEWFDDNVNENSETKKLINALANAKTAKVRLNGDSYYHVTNITSKQIKSIKNTLEYYKALGYSF